MRQWTDAQGRVTYAGSYAPYGEPREQQGDVTSRWGYTGEWWDADAQLLYLRARWLDVGRGRFTQRDPSGLEANLYLYAAANPIRFVDPSGYVYLTFDDGPNQTNDPEILRILAAHHAHATFFFVGKEIDSPADAEIVWRVVEEGHRLGNHTYAHDNLPDMCWDDVVVSLLNTESGIEAALLHVKTHQPLRYVYLSPVTRDYVDKLIQHGTGLFRPPYGNIQGYQQEMLECNHIAVSRSSGAWMVPGDCPRGVSEPWDVVRWTVDPFDHQVNNSGLPAETILDRIKNGWYRNAIGWAVREVRTSGYGSRGVRSNQDIILLHSNSDATVQILDDTLSWMEEQGYTFDLLEPAWK